MECERVRFASRGGGRRSSRAYAARAAHKSHASVSCEQLFAWCARAWIALIASPKQHPSSTHA
eukprot:11179272-Lingulodinium_polyedra.AAC.1